MRALNNEEFENFHKYVKCRCLECYAGMGLAGHGDCSARGAWNKRDCPEFETEDEFLEKWRKRNEEENPRINHTTAPGAKRYLPSEDI